jgi:hypothetical protein
MANDDLVRILRDQGVDAWNKWRKENLDYEIDLRQADLKGAKLSGADLRKAKLWSANLIEANLDSADLSGADLSWTYLDKAVFRGANLSRANLRVASLGKTNLSGADLREADLRGAYLRETDLRGADLSRANLRGARLIETNLERSILSECEVYGISARDLKLKDAQQNNLIITPLDGPVITVDDLEVAQFIPFLVNNENLLKVIDTIGNKAVLILGRFTPERKAVLDALLVELRNRGYLPILFDFDKPTTKDFTETIKILAGMSLFVIADISNPKSSPLELQATVPDYMVPFVPIIQAGEEPFAMFNDLQIKYDKWVLRTRKYDSLDSLIKNLDKAIITPALKVHNKLMEEKARKHICVNVEDVDDENDGMGDGIKLA